MTARGLLIAGAASGTGKTSVTLGVLRALHQRGIDVRAAKSGPDYIDPGFHAAACGHPSVNLDGFAMPPDELRARAAAQGGALLVIEGAMGALDGGHRGAGSAADLAAALDVPVLLVIDIAGMAQSAALPAAGLAALRPDLRLAGVILNRAGSDTHAGRARRAVEAAGIAVLGALPRAPEVKLPSRHLGLVQAGETAELTAILDRLGRWAARHLDIESLCAAARPLAAACGPHRRLPPLGQRIAVAQDQAFAFSYPHLLDDWRRAGAEIRFFAPLADQAPDRDADAVFLPGGYPELHAGRLAACEGFRAALAAAARAGVRIYGECGGYMALGAGLRDADGTRHRMLGLLPLETDFAARRLTLGYRMLRPLPGAPWDIPLAGHEFHYASVKSEGAAPRLYAAADSAGNALPPMGLQSGSVSGSFAHVIAAAP